MGVKIFKMDEDSFYKKYYRDWSIEKEKLNSDLESTTWKTRIYKKENEVNVTNEQVPAIQCSPTYVEPSKEEPKKVNNSTVNITLDPNIKVKIEEVEDARRDAAFKARTDPKNWVQDEIIHIDYEVQAIKENLDVAAYVDDNIIDVQLQDGEAHQQTKVSIRGEVAGAGSKKRGRPCGSRNKPRNGAGKLSKGAIENEGAGKGSKKRARRPTSLKKQNDGEEDKQSKGLREGEGGG